MNNENQNNSSRTAKRAARIGGFSVLIIAILLCALVVVNLIVLQIPAEYTMFDVSGLAFDDITDKSKKFLSDMTEDVTIYWLCEDGVTDEAMAMVLSAYAELSDHIDFEMIDPIEDPTFVAKYTSSELTNNSFIVESQYRFTIVDATEFYYYTNDFVDQQLNGGNTYKLTEEEFYSTYETYGAYMDAAPSYYFFQGEALLSSAIDYVTLPTIPHAYVLTGHGELAMSETLLSMLDVYQMKPEELNLQNAETLPEDASCIMLISPETDLSQGEATLLQAYVKAGGSLILVTSPACVGFENLASVTSLFGMSATEGMVVDTKENYFYKENHQIVPPANTSIYPLYTLSSAGYYAYMPMSHGISIAETLPEKVSATPMFATSDEAYRISTDGEKTKLCDPATQYVGAYGILNGTSAEGTATVGKLAWFASSKAFTDEVASQFSGSNYFYFSLMTRYMSDLYVSPYAEIQGINLTTPTLDGMTVNTAIALGIVIVVVIPVGLLTTGLVIWLKRRRR